MGIQIPRYERKIQPESVTVPKPRMPQLNPEAYGTKAREAEGGIAKVTQSIANMLAKRAEQKLQIENEKFNLDLDNNFRRSTESMLYDQNEEEYVGANGQKLRRPKGIMNRVGAHAQGSVEEFDRWAIQTMDKDLASVPSAEYRSKLQQSYKGYYNSVRNSILSHESKQWKIDKTATSKTALEKAKADTYLAQDPVSAREALMDVGAKSDANAMFNGIMGEEALALVREDEYKGALETMMNGALQDDITGTNASLLLDSVKDMLPKELYDTTKSYIAKTAKTLKAERKTAISMAQNQKSIEAIYALSSGDLDSLSVPKIQDWINDETMDPETGRAVIKGLQAEPGDLPGTTKSKKYESLEFIDYMEGVFKSQNGEDLKKSLTRIVESFGEDESSRNQMQVMIQVAKQYGGDQNELKRQSAQNAMGEVSSYNKKTKGKGNVVWNWLKLVAGGKDEQEAKEIAVAMDVQENAGGKKEEVLAKAINKNKEDPSSMGEDLVAYYMKGGNDEATASKNASDILKAGEGAETDIQAKAEVLNAMVEAVPSLKLSKPVASAVYFANASAELDKQLAKDVSEMGFIGKTIESGKRGNTSTSIDIYGFGTVMSRLGGGGEEEKEKFKQYKRAFDKMQEEQPIEAGNLPEKIIYALSSMAPAVARGSLEGQAMGATAGLAVVGAGALAGAPFAGVGSLATGTASLPLAMTVYASTVTVGATYFWTKQGIGSIYGDMIMGEYNPDGSVLHEPMDDSVAIPMALIGGPIYGIIENSQIVRAIPGGKKAVREMIRQSAGKVIKEATKKWGKGWMQEVGEEGLQKLTTEVSKEIGARIAGATNETIGKTITRIGSGVVKEMWEAGGPLAVFMGGQAISIGIEAKDTIKSNKQQDNKIARDIVNIAKIEEMRQKGEIKKHGEPYLREADIEGVVPKDNIVRNEDGTPMTIDATQEGDANQQDEAYVQKIEAMDDETLNYEFNDQGLDDGIERTREQKIEMLADKVSVDNFEAEQAKVPTKKVETIEESSLDPSETAFLDYLSEYMDPDFVARLSVEQKQMIAEMTPEEFRDFVNGVNQNTAEQKTDAQLYEEKLKQVEKFSAGVQTEQEKVDQVPLHPAEEGKKAMDKIDAEAGRESSNDKESMVNLSKKNPLLQDVEWEVENDEGFEEKWYTREELDAIGYKDSKPGYYFIAGSNTVSASGKRKIRLSSRATKSTIVEEVTEAIYKKLRTEDPALFKRIQSWENAVKNHARSLGIEVPDGVELFSQAFTFNVMGYADERPDIAEMIFMPDDLVLDFLTKFSPEQSNLFKGGHMPQVIRLGSHVAVN